MAACIAGPSHTPTIPHGELSRKRGCTHTHCTDGRWRCVRHEVLAWRLATEMGAGGGDSSLATKTPSLASASSFCSHQAWPSRVQIIIIEHAQGMYRMCSRPPMSTAHSAPPAIYHPSSICPASFCVSQPPFQRGRQILCLVPTYICM